MPNIVSPELVGQRAVAQGVEDSLSPTAAGIALKKERVGGKHSGHTLTMKGSASL